MSTDCYAMVRGSGLRVTALDRCGDFTEPIRYAASTSAIRVVLNEVSDNAPSELLRNDQEDPRIRLASSDQTIRYTLDADFLRVDPGILSLIAGTPVVPDALGNFIGFDSETKISPVAFGMEIWTRLAGENCVWNGAGFDTVGFDTDPFGGGVQVRQYGYTLFPFLKGGTLSGFAFTNGLVSFNLRGAQTRRMPQWNVGPYDINGPWQRLLTAIGSTTLWRTLKTSYPPPEQTDGVVEIEDIVDGGNASTTSADILDGEFVTTSDWIVDGGRS